ncbi:hypothetical protein C8Q78DRAFT_1073188 [Trametes maxima]|nr:hypothetical protein C8Q78DRAFT_1073188 [Trametes maxima]
MRSRFFTSLLLVFAAYASIASTSAAPLDRRANYTGRLFAHHAHERARPTSAPLDALHTAAADVVNAVGAAAATAEVEVMPTAFV